MISDRFSPSRVRFAASRPGLLRADPKGWLFMREKGGALCKLFGVRLCRLFGVMFEYGPTGGTHRRGSNARAGSVPFVAAPLGGEPSVTAGSSGSGNSVADRTTLVEKYQQFGLAALARRKRADSGEHRAVSVKIREAIEGLALQKPLARGDRAKLAAGRLEGVRLENSRLKITRKLMCNPRLEGT